MARQDPDRARYPSEPSRSGDSFVALIAARTGGEAPVGLKICGISLDERLRRQLAPLGAREVVDAARLAETRTGESGILLIEAGLVADERLLAAFLDTARRRGPRARALLAIGPDGRAGGLAWLPAALTLRGVPDWDELASGLADRCDLGLIDDYAPERRRRVPLLWERPADAVAARRVSGKVLAAAQKGCLDWPARLLHPPIENLLVRVLWPLPISPNMISLLAFGLGLYAAWCFASGQLWTGLLIALAVGPIDGIDGKLARTRVEFSRWGDLEHVGDKIVEYLWFAGLAASFGTGLAWALAALIVLFAFAEAIQGEFFRRMAGFQLDDAGPLERGYRLISGRRNTYFWALLPFALWERWDLGLIAIAAYSVLNFFFVEWRFFVRLAEYGRAHSQAIASNLAATAYHFVSSAEEEPGGRQERKIGTASR